MIVFSLTKRGQQLAVWLHCNKQVSSRRVQLPVSVTVNQEIQKSFKDMIYLGWSYNMELSIISNQERALKLLDCKTEPNPFASTAFFCHDFEKKYWYQIKIIYYYVLQVCKETSKFIIRTSN